MTALLASFEMLALGLIAAGALFCLSATVGVIRFPDVYTRLHAGTKCLTAGALLILAGVAILEASWSMSGRVLLIAFFLLATNPIAGHAVARAAYRRSDAHFTIAIDELRGRLPDGPCGDWSISAPVDHAFPSGPRAAATDPLPFRRRDHESPGD